MLSENIKMMTHCETKVFPEENNKPNKPKKLSKIHQAKMARPIPKKMLNYSKKTR